MNTRKEHSVVGGNGNGVFSFQEQGSDGDLPMIHTLMRSPTIIVLNLIYTFSTMGVMTFIA